MGVRFSKLVIGALLLVGSIPAALAGGYGYSGWGGHYGYGHHYRHGGYYGAYGDADGYLAFGLLAGTLLGYAIASSYEPTYYRRPYWRDYRYDEYYEPVPPRVVYVQPAPAPAPAPKSPQCLQEREYQTLVTIDGQQVQAWGIACLQPDGSWLRPGLNIVPNS